MPGLESKLLFDFFKEHAFTCVRGFLGGSVFGAACCQNGSKHRDHAIHPLVFVNTWIDKG